MHMPMRVFLLLFTLLLTQLHCTLADEEVLPQWQEFVAKLGDGPARENSGIVHSRSRDNLFWMHNDSRDEPRIYPVRRDGSVYASERYSSKPGVLIGGAINVDWEDITSMPDGTIVVADLGNNRNDRRDLVLYFLDEPSPYAGRTTYRKKVFVRYPDQSAFPAPKDVFNYDCEAVCTIGKSIYLLTKHRSDMNTKVYRLSDYSEGVTHELKFLQEFTLGGQAVAADTLPDGSKLVVATYETLWLFDLKNPDRPLANPIGKLPYKADNVEAVCFDGPEAILYADEATAKLYRTKTSAFHR